MPSPSHRVRLTYGLLLVQAGLWLAFGLITAVGAHPSYRAPGPWRWGMAAGSLLVAVVILALTALLRRQHRPAFWLLTALLGLLFVGGWLDQLGPLDAVYLALTALTIVLLLKDRRVQLPVAPDPFAQTGGEG